MSGNHQLGRAQKGWLRHLAVLALAVFGLAAAAQDLESLIVDRLVGPEGQEIVAIKTLPIPERPAGFDTNAVKSFPKTAVTLTTPAFDWTYGCSATSAGMMFGYYDRNGYPNFYTGPAGGGVCPLTNETWGKSTYPGVTCGNCPIVATKQGVDARADYGHVNDYWYDSDSQVDPYYTGGWTQHAPLDCAADFMGTNQYQNWANVDGSTTFYWNPNGDPLYDYDPEDGRDGCHGMKLFANYCGYTVPTHGNYNQYIDTKVAGGFTFAQYRAEIDAGRPVLIQVNGHTMLGVGYEAASNTVYLHDTWDYLTHEMIWGGSYSNMEHYGVTVLRLASASASLSASPSTLTPSATVGGSPANGSFSLSATSGSIAYTIGDDASWLSCSPGSGTATTTPQTITVTYSAAALGAGTYTATITATGGGSTATVDVTLTISSAASYTVTIGSTFTVASPIALSKKPKVYASGAKNANAKVLDYTASAILCEWTAKAPAGIYELWVKAGKEEEQVTSNFVVAPPIILDYEDAIPQIYLYGAYFGTSKPSVWVEYSDPNKGKAGKLKCKVLQYNMNEVLCEYSSNQYNKLVEKGVIFTAIAFKNKIGTAYIDIK